VRGSFKETAPRKTIENTVKHRDGGVDSMIASHHYGGKSSVVVTTLVSLVVGRSKVRVVKFVFHTNGDNVLAI